MDIPIKTVSICTPIVYRLSYANQDGDLPDYLPIKYICDESRIKSLCSDNLAIPSEATHIAVKAYDREMNLIGEGSIDFDSRYCTLPEAPLMRIALISDLHTVEKGRSKRILSEAFGSIRAHGVDIVIAAGDNTNGCQQGEFDVLLNSIHNHLGTVPFFAALGNHDFFPNQKTDIPCTNARESFLRQITEQADLSEYFCGGNFSIRKNGLHIIFLDCIQNNRNFRFDDSLGEWLTNELKKSQSDRFRIIVNHLPLTSHNLGCQSKSKEFMAGNKKLQKIIDVNKHIIYVSGHTHNRLDSDYPSVEQDKNGNIYINASSVGNTQPCIRDMTKLKNLRENLTKCEPMRKEIDRFYKMSSMGLFMEVYADIIAIRGYDFSQKKYIPRCFFAFSTN